MSVVTNGSIAVDTREMDRNERVHTLIAMGLGVVWPVAHLHPDAELVPLQREPHRAWPTCDAREWPRYPDPEWWQPHEEFSWCPKRARWCWGVEQKLCPLHAAQLALGIAVVGIAADGAFR
jgi:hypothetical protein